MRVLVVARWAPWPPRSGARLRSANVIEAISRLGEVDVFLLGHPTDTLDLCPPPSVPLARTYATGRPVSDRDRGTRLRWLATGRLPLQLHGLDYGDVRRQFSEWAGQYDVAWYVRPESYLAVGDLVESPSIIDLDDLHERTQGPRLATWPDGRHGGSRDVKAWMQRRVTATNTRRWARLERRLAASADSVVVCSEVDRARLGGHPAVVPNGMDLPDEPVGATTVSDPPTLVFHGSLGYPPNADAAERLVADVLPRVRAALPGATLRLVGTADRRVERLHAPPAAVVTGWVDDLSGELARADVLAAPLRFGSGTKIKILEALTHGIPVVTTTVGAEGLAVEHERHVLIADDPNAFADQCVRVLRDRELRARLAREGRALVEHVYPWSRIHDDVVELVHRVAARQ